MIDVITHFSNFETRNPLGILNLKFPYKTQQESRQGLHWVYVMALGDVWCQLPGHLGQLFICSRVLELAGLERWLGAAETNENSRLDIPSFQVTQWLAPCIWSAGLG